LLIGIAALILITLSIFRSSLKLMFKLFINTLVGFVVLWLINFFGAYLGISIGMNWVNALVIGVLGVPGAALLLILKYLALM